MDSTEFHCETIPNSLYSLHAWFHPHRFILYMNITGIQVMLAVLYRERKKILTPKLVLETR